MTDFEMPYVIVDLAEFGRRRSNQRGEWISFLHGEYVKQDVQNGIERRRAVGGVGSKMFFCHRVATRYPFAMGPVVEHGEGPMSNPIMMLVAWVLHIGWIGLGWEKSKGRMLFDVEANFRKDDEAKLSWMHDVACRDWRMDGDVTVG